MDADTDPCGSDNFYDEIASFMPQPGDYTLDDLDEILRSTDSQLDSSLDFSSLVTPNVHDFDVGALDAQQQEAAEYLLQQEAAESLLHQDYKFELSAYPSPASSHQSGCTPSYETPQSQRSTSTSSTDEDSFNPDEFMNFFADDDIKIEEISADVPAIVMDDELPRRRTPSPTGSCSSSGGSSTSGVHSDFSSVVSMSSASANKMTTFMITDELERSHNAVPAAVTNRVASTAASGAPNTLPISVLPLQRTAASAPAATIIQPLQQVLIPVKALPALPITSIQSVGGMKMHTPAPIIKVEPKLAPKVITVQQPAKIVTPVTSAPAATTVGGAKITPPPNAKPKTIFLSSKDFKALMQKMNTNGSTAKGAKITGGINGQMPKIIMKTANGKVITANKLVQPLGSSLATVHQPTQQHHFAPKIVKANGAHVIKHQSQQQPTKAAVSNAIAVAAARAGITSSSTHIVPDLSIYKGMIDDKMFKKQQRMIKNRESASLSRKKKKEYVVSLESRINNLEKENYTLKGENTSLRSQLMAYAQTCQCRHSNISEFILNSLNISTKGHHSSEHNHVKIAPKPAPKSLKQRMTAANVRKNVAVLFAMAFMVTLNVGNFQTYFNKNSIESSIEAAGEAAITATGSAESLGAGRQLLWVESETEFHEKLNRSKREAELEVQPPPLHFLRPLNRTATFGNGTAREPPLNCSSNAAGSSNQTEENMRLVNKLHKWIDGNDYLNLSLREKFGNDLDNSVGFKLTPDYLEWNSIELQTGPGGKQKRKFFIQRPQYGNKQRKLDIDVDVDNDKYNGNAIDKGNDNDNGNGNDRNSLELFKPKLSEEYVRLFKGIKRQDDTFYVVSFNTDHILLPASVYNKSARPKMSLMLPAADPSLNGDIVLMQIDCEVVNTTELELKSHMIPEKLRPNKYKNDNPTAEANSTEVANNETRTPDSNSQERSYMPAPVLSKERPPLPRTYFMMGPKTQAAMKKKPTIVKLNGNDSVSHLNALNVKNSTLFAKMRETVEAEES